MGILFAFLVAVSVQFMTEKDSILSFAIGCARALIFYILDGKFTGNNEKSMINTGKLMENLWLIMAYLCAHVNILISNADI